MKNFWSLAAFSAFYDLGIAVMKPAGTNFVVPGTDSGGGSDPTNSGAETLDSKRLGGDLEEEDVGTVSVTDPYGGFFPKPFPFATPEDVFNNLEKVCILEGGNFQFCKFVCIGFGQEF